MKGEIKKSQKRAKKYKHLTAFKKCYLLSSQEVSYIV